MRAIVYTRYGPPEVLQLKEVEKPAPRDNEVLIKMHATTVTAGDCEMRSLKLPLAYQLMLRLGFGFRGPRNAKPGSEVAGEVVASGQRCAAAQSGRPSLWVCRYEFWSQC